MSRTPGTNTSTLSNNSVQVICFYYCHRKPPLISDLGYEAKHFKIYCSNCISIILSDALILYAFRQRCIKGDTAAFFFFTLILTHKISSVMDSNAINHICYLNTKK